MPVPDRTIAKNGNAENQPNSIFNLPATAISTTEQHVKK